VTIARIVAQVVVFFACVPALAAAPFGLSVDLRLEDQMYRAVVCLLRGGRCTPRSVLLYESLKAAGRVPVMLVKGHPLNVANLCPLLARARSTPQPFVTQPSDMDGHVGCDFANVILAFGGASNSGVLNATAGPHFMQSHWPCARVEVNDDGLTIIRLEHIATCTVVPTAADEDAGLTFLLTPPPEWPIYTGWGSTLYPEEWRGVFPPTKEP
jgi:hypothetical protein